MSKQTKPIAKLCQSRKHCLREATWGVFAFVPGGAQTDVNLDKPLRVYCGMHKPTFQHPDQGRRLLKLARA